jgi:enoyl-CoA hydratase/carnithine racemase
VEATRAFELGIANRVLPPDELLPAALALAKTLAQGAPLALAQIKAATRAGLTGTLAEALAREAAGQAKLLASQDLVEGVAAWAQRRKPEFRGT